MDKMVSEKQKEKFQKMLLPNELLIQKPFENNEMPLLYNAADLVILTSKAEGLGMALLEAMACGTPVIGTKVMGIDEVIEKGINGELVSWGNEKKLVESILKITLNPKTRKKYITGGFETLAEKFNIKQQAKAHIEVYKKLIEERGRDKNRQSERQYDSATLKKLIYSLSSYKALKNSKQLMAILLIGSIFEGKFIPGWSDIDLLVLARRPDTNFFSSVSAFQAKLQKTTKAKAGVEIVDYDSLLKATNNPFLANSYIKFIKNFYYQNRLKPKSVIYSQKAIKFPCFNQRVIRKLSVSSHATATLSYMYKYFANQKHQADRKDLLRKIIKNSLLLMQVYLLVKFGDFESDYDKVIQKYSAVQNKSLTGLQETFGKRFRWSRLKDSDISDEEIEKNWQIFLEVTGTNLRSKV